MYLFDTDTLSVILRAERSIANTQLRDRFIQTPPSARHTSTINLGELLYGAERVADQQRRARLITGIRQLLSLVTILPFDGAAAEEFGQIRAEVERRGQPRAIPDLMVGAVGLSQGLIVVTGNLTHFQAIPGLNVENWITRT